MSAPKCVTVFGGSGFLGGEIARRLLAEGIAVRIAVRHADRVTDRVNQRPDQTGEPRPVTADVRDQTSVARAIEGCDAVVNAVGLYVEQGAETFEAIHEAGARNVARQSTVSGVARLVHISGIGADLRSGSRYVRARAKGEVRVKEAFPPATILRPKRRGQSQLVQR